MERLGSPFWLLGEDFTPTVPRYIIDSSARIESEAKSSVIPLDHDFDLPEKAHLSLHFHLHLHLQLPVQDIGIMLYLDHANKILNNELMEACPHAYHS